MRLGRWERVGERRSVLWLVAGIGGLAVAIAAVAFGLGWLSIVAGVVALAAGLAASRLVTTSEGQHRALRDLENRLASLESDVAREAAAREAEARAVAERADRADAAGEGVGADERDHKAVRRDVAQDNLTDSLTGLFSEDYFLVALDSRVAAARRQLRPVAVVLLEVIDDLDSALPHPADAVAVSDVVRTTLREADTPCRLDGGAFALLLEDTPENGAIWTVERLRRALAEVPGQHTVWAGIACYPAHGFTTDEILDRAERALSLAREWRQDRIEVAD